MERPQVVIGLFKEPEERLLVLSLPGTDWTPARSRRDVGRMVSAMQSEMRLHAFDCAGGLISLTLMEAGDALLDDGATHEVVGEADILVDGAILVGGELWLAADPLVLRALSVAVPCGRYRIRLLRCVPPQAGDSFGPYKTPDLRAFTALAIAFGIVSLLVLVSYKALSSQPSGPEWWFLLGLVAVLKLLGAQGRVVYYRVEHASDGVMKVTYERLM